MSIKKAKHWVRYGTCGVALACLSLNIAAADEFDSPERRFTEATTATTMGRASTKAQVTVNFADLDLSEQADVDRLYQRIAQAAREVCRPTKGIWHTVQPRVQRSCFRRSMDRSILKVGHPGLQQTHLAATGRDIDIDERIAGR